MKKLIALIAGIACLPWLTIPAPVRAQEALDQMVPIRGLCIAAPNPRQVDAFVRFIREELAARAVNTLILRVDFNYQYTSRPELASRSGLSRAEVNKLVEACRASHIRLIPQINLLGHQSWHTQNGALLRVYPEFDETPWVKMPEKYTWPNPDGLYCRSYCPLHPKVHEVVLPLVDEICEVFAADAFHAGMDEVFYLGEARCPRCGGKDKAELFAGEVKKIRDHLQAKGRQLWIWGDRLLDGKLTGLGEWEASFNETHRAIDLIPKEVMICDWHYDRADPTAVYFAMKGFNVVTCPWMNPHAALQQLRDLVAFREQSPQKMKNRFQGMVQTVWSDPGSFMNEVQGHRQSAEYKRGEKTAARCFLALFDAIQDLKPKVAASKPTETGELIFQDDFNGKLAEGWSFEREDRGNWRVGASGLEVRVQPGNMWGGANNAKNVMVRSIPNPGDMPVEISVTFSNQPTAQWEQANLVWYYDGGNMVKLGQELVTGRLSIVMGREEGDRARTVAIVPLDAYTVELRLQAVNHRVRGQFRTAPGSNWRDIGECDRPEKGEPKASLHFYNGPANEEHWVRVNRFAVRRLPVENVDWPRVRVEEKRTRASDASPASFASLPLPGDFVLLNDLRCLKGDSKADYAETIFRHRDGTYGWEWDRRASTSADPTLAGVWWGAGDAWPGLPATKFSPLSVTNVKSLELELDAVTWLGNDQGDHNLIAVIAMKPAASIKIWFDWYGPASEAQTLNDGLRDYGFIATPAGAKEIQYRIQGFRGAPPRVNLKAFLEDAAKRGLSPDSQVLGVWFGNEIWNGSRGGTLVNRLSLLMNGQRHAGQAR